MLHEVYNSEESKLAKTLIVFDNVEFVSSGGVLFSHASFPIRAHESVAVIGEAGSGKSVMLKLAIGEEKPTNGSITLAKNVRVSYVPQQTDSVKFNDHSTVKGLFYSARGLEKLERQIAETTVLMATDSSQRVMNRYGDLIVQYERLDGYSADSQISAILNGLGVEQHINLETVIKDVSSGQKAKILIGQALFARPDLIVLDDPVSHLDAESRAWLANYLRGTKQGSLIVVSSTEFVNEFAQKIIEINGSGRVIVFEGNFNQFSQKKDVLLESERRTVERKRDEYERIRSAATVVQGWGRKTESTARKQRVIQRKVERKQQELEALSDDQIEQDRNIRPRVFEKARKSAIQVININGITKRYDNGFIGLNLPQFCLTIQRGERVAVVGRNGSGKSTLLRLVAYTSDGMFVPTSGILELGSNVDIGYYSPDLIGNLDDQKLILDEAFDNTERYNKTITMSTLAYWGLADKVVYNKRIGDLSASQKSQLIMAKVMLACPNLLVLDEPTSHFSPNMINRLVGSLLGYDGTLIVVSHESIFLDKLGVHKKILLPNGSLESF